MNYRIKPLLWKPFVYPLWVADGRMRYSITKDYHGFLLYVDGKSKKRYTSVEEAKAAAESHYMERLTGDGGCLELVEQETTK